MQIAFKQQIPYERQNQIFFKGFIGKPLSSNALKREAVLFATTMADYVDKNKPLKGVLETNIRKIFFGLQIEVKDIRELAGYNETATNLPIVIRKVNVLGEKTKGELFVNFERLNELKNSAAIDDLKTGLFRIGRVVLSIADYDFAGKMAAKFTRYVAKVKDFRFDMIEQLLIKFKKRNNLDLDIGIKEISQYRGEKVDCIASCETVRQGKRIANTLFMNSQATSRELRYCTIHEFTHVMQTNGVSRFGAMEEPTSKQVIKKPLQIAEKSLKEKYTMWAEIEKSLALIGILKKPRNILQFGEFWDIKIEQFLKQLLKKEPIMLALPEKSAHKVFAKIIRNILPSLKYCSFDEMANYLIKRSSDEAQAYSQEINLFLTLGGEINPRTVECLPPYSYQAFCDFLLIMKHNKAKRLEMLGI